MNNPSPAPATNPARQQENALEATFAGFVGKEVYLRQSGDLQLSGHAVGLLKHGESLWMALVCDGVKDSPARDSVSGFGMKLDERCFARVDSAKEIAVATVGDQKRVGPDLSGFVTTPAPVREFTEILRHQIGTDVGIVHDGHGQIAGKLVDVIGDSNNLWLKIAAQEGRVDFAHGVVHTAPERLVNVMKVERIFLGQPAEAQQ